MSFAFAGLQGPDSSLDGSQNFWAFLVLFTTQFVIKNFQSCRFSSWVNFGSSFRISFKLIALLIKLLLSHDLARGFSLPARTGILYSDRKTPDDLVADR